MSNNKNVNSIIIEGKSLNAKYEVHNMRSGEVGLPLRSLPGGMDLYTQVQRSEVVLHGAKREWDARYSAYQESRLGEEQLRRTVLAMAKAAVSVAEVSGISHLRDILVADDNDEAAIAARLAADIKSIPFVGEGFSQGLSVLRERLLAKEAAHQEVVAAFEASTREFGGAYYRAAAIVAQAKALLVASGIKVNDRKVPKKKKPTDRKEDAATAGASE
ncbi:MAG: hypothetical protein ACOZIN_08345 [Myxococcota bacterium]